MLCSIFVYTCLGYVALLFGCHMIDCWQHPPIKAAPIAAESPVLLLPPAALPHPFELSLKRMPHVEAIAAVHQPAAALEPTTDTLTVEKLLEMTIRELKRIASDRKIPGYSKCTKSELIELLTV